METLKMLRPALVSFVALTLITGMAYPLAITGVAQATMPSKADGSLLSQDGRLVGSSLVGQPFTRPEYFWPRPSAIGTSPYDAASGAGSNLGPTNPALISAVEARGKALRAADPEARGSIPVDLVTASASGLDPHISPAAAEYQVGRVARTRGLVPQAVRAQVARFTEGRELGLFGEPRVNVLLLNRALDAAR